MTSTHDAPDLPAHLLSERTHLRLPSKPHWIEAIVEWLRQKAILAGACQESRAGKLLVALHEALSNAIVHGNLELSSALKERGDDSFGQALAERVADPRLSERIVDVHIECDVSRCRWSITDEGAGFDVAAVLRRHESDDPEVLLSSGRGILIMKSFLDEVRWDLGGRRLVLALARQSGEEKRRELRIPRQQPVRVAPIQADGTVDWQAAYEAVSRNCSENGIGVLQERLASNERILIGMMVQDQMVYLPAEVRHRRNMGGDVVELGCRFQVEAPATPVPPPKDGDPVDRLHDAVTALLERHAAPRLTSDERRLFQRLMYTERIEIQAIPGEPMLPAYARDLSKGGISFIVHTLLPPEITVLLRPRDGTAPLCVRAKVVRCNKIIEGFYDVGAQFVHLEPVSPS